MGTGASKGGGTSLLSLGLSAMSTINEGKGKKAGFDFQADKAARAAEFGKINLANTDTAYREQLTTTLGQIDAQRAAGNVDPTSPTTGVLEDRQRTLSDRQRTAALASIQGQIDEDTASAAYLRKAGDYAVYSSYWKAGADAFGKLDKAGDFFSMFKKKKADDGYGIGGSDGTWG
jgi:hypothetical protein